MGLASFDRVCVRDATVGDLPALTQLKQSEALHRDRLRDAQKPTSFRYLVLEQASHVIGFACLVFVRPRTWSDAHDASHLPQLVDVLIAPALRGQGYGSYLVSALEQMAAQLGSGETFLAVDPQNNPRAYALYKRVGYRPIQMKPYLKHWEFVDSAGNLHLGDDWTVDMVKSL